MEAFKLDQFIKCPHCSSAISYEHDLCPECDNQVYDFEVELEKEDVFINDYIEFVSVPVEAKNSYKAAIFVAFFAIVISVLWALNIILKFDGNQVVPEAAYFIFFAGIFVICVTELLILKEKRKFNQQVHRSDYHQYDNQIAHRYDRAG